jgi:hypothetical protein
MAAIRDLNSEFMHMSREQLIEEVRIANHNLELASARLAEVTGEAAQLRADLRRVKA